ncbi:MAG TPA: replication initiator protein A [Gemmatirosa sp.]
MSVLLSLRGTTVTDQPQGSPADEAEARRSALVHRPLERYPWSRISDQEPDADEVELRLLLEAAGEEGRAWTVRPRSLDRVPGPFEADLYVAMCELYNAQVPRERRGEIRSVMTTYAQLARLMGREKGGSTYRSIDQGLDRLRDVEIRAVQTWRQGKVSAQETTFGIIASVTRQYGRGATGKNARGATSKNAGESGGTGKNAGGATGKNEAPVIGLVVKWDPDFAAAIAEGQSRILDTARYFALPTPTARRLYRYLDQRRWRGKMRVDELVLPVSELVKRLPIERSAPSHVRRTLDPAHGALVEQGYLQLAEYVETPRPGKKRRDLSVRYVFAEAPPGLPTSTVTLVAEGEPPVSGEETLIAKLNAVARWLGTFDHYTEPEDVCQRLTMRELKALLTEVSADATVAGVPAPARLAALLIRAEQGIEVFTAWELRPDSV